MCNTEYIELMINSFTALSIFIGAIVAIIGLSTWRKQLKGESDYDLARRYLRAVYRIRDTAKHVGDSTIPFDEKTSVKEKEYKKIIKNTNKKDIDSFNNEIIRIVYYERWKKYCKSVSDLDPVLLDAEISWGHEAVNIQEDFKKQVRQVYVSFVIGNGGEKIDPKKHVIYGPHGNKNDYNKAVSKSIKKIENYLKPYLK